MDVIKYLGLEVAYVPSIHAHIGQYCHMIPLNFKAAGENHPSAYPEERRTA